MSMNFSWYVTAGQRPAFSRWACVATRCVRLGENPRIGWGILSGRVGS